MDNKLKDLYQKRERAVIARERADLDIEELTKKIENEEASLVKDRQTLIALDRKLAAKREDLSNLKMK